MERECLQLKIVGYGHSSRS